MLAHQSQWQSLELVDEIFDIYRNTTICILLLQRYIQRGNLALVWVYLKRLDFKVIANEIYTMIDHISRYVSKNERRWTLM